MKDFIYKILLLIILSSVLYFIVAIVKTIINILLEVGG